MKPKGYRLQRVRETVCAIRGHKDQPQPGGVVTCTRCKRAVVPVGMQTVDDLVADYPDRSGQ